MKSILLTSVFLFGTTGCLTVGQDFPTETVWISPNKTTRKDLEKYVGEPFRVGNDTGFLTYTYAYYKYSLLRPADTKDLTVRFNPDGTVNSYTITSSFEDDKVKMKNKK